MKLYLKSLLFVAIIITLHSCDCRQEVTGTVLDASTKQPVVGAYAQNVNKSYNHSFTDDKGDFQVNSISGGFRGCPPMEVAITKPNYEIKVVEMEVSKHDTIYLSKIN